MENWFLKRGLTVLNYQKEAIDKVQQSLIDNYETILAACPGAGKTIMSIYALDMYLYGNSSKKAMVLTHGTTILRSQYHDVLEQITPDFKFCLVEKYEDLDGCSVNVCLPQTIYRRELPKIDLLVVDEAHQFYEASMVKEIIKKTRPERILLLTGSPSPFIAQKKEIIPVSINTVFDEGRISDLYIEVAESKYSFGFNDYNKFDELLSNKHFNKNDTERTLDNLLEKVVYRFHSVNFEVEHKTSWNYILQSFRKTMFACRSQEQARQVKHYFDSIGVKCSLSISDEDEDSEEIKIFKKEPSISVLIVVYRGILGFDFPPLINIVDMTMSQNVDRIFQLMCRIIRPYQDNNKFFFKIAPDGYGDYFTYLMNGVLAMSHDDFYTRYNGRNFKELEFPIVIKKDSEKSVGIGSGTKKKGSGLKMIELEGLPAFEFMKKIYSKDSGMLSSVSYTTMRDVKNELGEINYRGYWTLDKCKESALKYKSRKEWQISDNSAYQAAQRNKWMEECCFFMDILWEKKWTLDSCKESALKYKSRKEWQKAGRGSYNSAHKNNWLEICCSHMEYLNRPKGYWTLERCKESALKFKTRTEWKKGEPSAYNSAHKNDWINICCSHMEQAQKPNNYWTFELCKKSALKFEKKSEWNLGDRGAYQAAKRNKWMEECCSHMKTLINHWTLKDCKESALKYKTKKEWKEAEAGIYSFCQKKGWLDKFCEHMDILWEKKWTLDSCKESALKYKTKTEWQKGQVSAYNSAHKNGWLDLCCLHMEEGRKQNNYWTLERCKESALKFDSKIRWKKGQSSAYNVALKNKWLDECCAHMKKSKPQNEN